MGGPDFLCDANLADFMLRVLENSFLQGKFADRYLSILATRGTAKRSSKGPFTYPSSLEILVGKLDGGVSTSI